MQETLNLQSEDVEMKVKSFLVTGGTGNYFTVITQKEKSILNWSTHIFQASFLLFCILNQSSR
jgi:hypothetical protein